MDQGIKSRPRYPRLRPDPAAMLHLVVTDQPRPPRDAFEATPDPCEIWMVRPANGQAPDGTAFASAPALLEALGARLATAGAGLRVCAIGTEPFIWDAEAVCRDAGMGRDEIFLAQSGSLRRRVWCSHCARIIEDVTSSIVPCPGCGAHLFVRDHFSRRLRAFMGVRVDAEVPGEIPVAEEIYR